MGPEKAPGESHHVSGFFLHGVLFLLFSSSDYPIADASEDALAAQGGSTFNILPFRLERDIIALLLHSLPALMA